MKLRIANTHNDHVFYVMQCVNAKLDIITKLFLVFFIARLHNHRYRMPYRVWEEKLRQKVKNWYDVLEAYNGDTYKVPNLS